MISLLKPASAALALFVAATLPAQAISRYNSESLTCHEAQSIVAGEGAAILRYRSQRNPSLTLYDRYVANGAFCSLGETVQHAYVPTADRQSCPVYTCKQDDFEDYDWRD